MAKAAGWGLTDAEARKRGKQTGLDTLVVRTVNNAYWVSGGIPGYRSQRVKYAAWGVRTQV